ncbi:protein ABC transporter 1, mitochondrial [Tanacetum coccineum]
MQEMVTMNQGLNGNGRNQNQNQFTRMTKVEFPKFSGDDVKGWIFRCEQFFSIDEILKNQKEHVVSFYLGGLPTEIEMGVRMFRPKTLAGAYQLTNLQEATLKSIKKKNKAVLSSQNGRFGGRSNSYGSNAKSSLLPLPSSNSSWRTKPNTPTSAPIRKQMTQKEYQEKRAQNLCFYCDQKYTPWHKCSRQLFSIVLLADEELDCEEEYMEEESLMLDEVPRVSLNALNGINSFQTMRITGKIGKHEVHILVDYGTTLNFLDVNVAKQVGCKIKSTYPLAVTVGGGRKLISDVVCKNFEWQLQGDTFYTDMMILPLGGCEMWLEGKNQDKEFEGTANAELLMFCVYPNTGVNFMNIEGQTKKEVMDPELSKVVDTFEDVFLVST